VALSIYIEAHSIAACLIDILSQEKIDDTLFVLSHGGKSREEVTISTIALLDVSYIYLTEDLEITSSPNL